MTITTAKDVLPHINSTQAAEG